MKVIINPEEEEKYRRVRELSKKLCIPSSESFLEVEMSLRGKPYAHWKQRGHTWVRNAYNIAICQMAAKSSTGTYGDGASAFKDTSGTQRTTTAPTMGKWKSGYDGGYLYPFDDLDAGYRASGVSSQNGIVIGSSSTAYDFDQYALISQILHGIGSGQIVHNPMEVNSVYYNSGTKTWTNSFVRYFNNDSEGNLTLGEVGIYAVSSGYYLMVTRDVLGTPETIYNTAQVKITYTISLIYPY